MFVTAADDRRCPDAEATSTQPEPGRPGLARDEEIELAARVACGDLTARDRMVRANLGLVHTIAREFCGRGIDLDDLVGEGNLGLLRATQEFDPRFGTRFSTYASYWIKQAIRQALITTTATIRLPAHMVGLLTRWRRAERALRSELGRAPEFDEVASSLGLSAAQKTMVARAHHARQLTPGSGQTGEVNEWWAEGAIDGREAAEARLQAEDELGLLLSRLDRLDHRERTILSLRYGLEGETLTLKQIGRRLGMTREWARKLELRALAKIREGSAVEAEGARRDGHPSDSRRSRATTRRRRAASRSDQFKALGSVIA